MERGDVGVEEVNEFVKYVIAVNEIADKLKELLEEYIETPDWGYYNNMYEIPLNKFKKLAYLSEVRKGNLYITIFSKDMHLDSFLLLYRAYETGLLREIIEDLRRDVSELRRRKYMLKRAEKILEKIGVSRL